MYQDRLHTLTSDMLEKIKRIIIAGDLHGDYESFQRICSLFNSDEDFLIFLGDYADRGSKGLEVINGVEGLLTFHY